ncbi:serine hydrolase domain-containing protein [Flagellimonas nanhaiensis]|uniref:Class C beta-lactamase-related serine hydrolase n=1 Tax=Flagellimonas nanhaiensis TaxID=2292706 RepID=A0A371JPE3_9FLAO|nr:serine hydrolase [Allomuricauda nanhaiensis]RDY59384.1 class C beta-lactamase-related serine hydrolase [Allomuricauda nanhaiensis]
MLKYLRILVLLCLSTVVGYAQNNKQDYQGEWVGFLPNKSSFNFQVSIAKLEGDNYHLTIANDKIIIDENVVSSSSDRIRFAINQQLFFNLQYEPNGQELSGFIKTGRFLYHISLQKTENNTFTGAWNAFMVDSGLQSDDILLYIENTEEGNYVAYPFFGDQRFRGTWTEGFTRKGDTLFFRDGNTGLNFRANLLEKAIELEILLTDVLITKTKLTHTTEGWEYKTDTVDQSQNAGTPPQLADGWATANISDYGIDKDNLLRLIESVHANTLVNTHSVLIAKENKLVFESYFGGFNADIPHDLRSASKSISSAIIGVAIDDKIIESVEEKLYDFIPETYQYTKDSLKSKIRIKDLLTMSSGLDVNNLAAENYYQDPERNSKSWLQAVLEAPMVNDPGTYADYGSANPFLLGVCLNERLSKPVEIYMDEKLFAPLGITNYINQTDNTEITPYFGGGMLLTPRDLLKFGQLYLNKGKWQGKQIISEDWVLESTMKHVRLQNVKDKNEYGYQWWHDTYLVNGRAIESIEARGAGGQFIFILPKLDAVVVITSGNFRNGKGNQSRDILKEYILPAILN